MLLCGAVAMAQAMAADSVSLALATDSASIAPADAAQIPADAAQIVEKTQASESAQNAEIPEPLPKEEAVPEIEYSYQRKTYEIAGIEVVGADSYEDFVLIGFSGLAVGDKIEIPGDQITKAIKRFWKQGLFSDVKIKAKRLRGRRCGCRLRLSSALVCPMWRITDSKKRAGGCRGQGRYPQRQPDDTQSLRPRQDGDQEVPGGEGFPQC